MMPKTAIPYFNIGFSLVYCLSQHSSASRAGLSALESGCEGTSPADTGATRSRQAPPAPSCPGKPDRSRPAVRHRLDAAPRAVEPHPRGSRSQNARRLCRSGTSAWRRAADRQMNFITLVQALVDEGVDFVIIGGWCAILHVSSYLTNDLDFCYSRVPGNLKRLAAALAPYHPRLRDLPADLPFVWDEVTLRHGTIFTLSTHLGVVDLMAEVAGVGDFEATKAHSKIGRASCRER